jgi:uroporphyrinogen III methyltransferase/synthase
MEGKVWLVGAGPGDPRLITVKGREALAAAEVIVYDRLVSKEFLDYAAEGAEVIYAGRQEGLHDFTDEEIDALLVRKAREGKRVVRLLGGDPFVFGGGGEEAVALRAAGVPFEVVNGVTSSVAAPAHAGIPITFGGVAASFAVVAGNDDPDAPDAPVNWSRLATAVDTLVLVAAAANLDRVAAALVRHGRAPDTPVAVVSWGTYGRQETVVGTLADIARRVAEAGVLPPAITVVGEVVRLRERMRWYDDRPLFGKRVLVTRSRQQAGALRRLLRDEGAEVLELPALEVVETAAPEIIERVVSALADGQYGWAIFTAANAVDLFFRHLTTFGRDARAFGVTKVCAIGTEAAEALAARSISADVVLDEAVGQVQLSAMVGRGVGRRRILLPRAGNTRPELIAALRRLGAEVEDIPLYVTAIPRLPDRESLARLRRGELDIVTFATSTAVANLVKMLGDDLTGLRRATIACMGTLTAQAAREAGLPVAVAVEDDRVEDLVRALRAHAAG